MILNKKYSVLIGSDLSVLVLADMGFIIKKN